MAIADAWSGYVLYAIAVVVTGALGILARIYFDSSRGLVSLAIRENELRVEYLGEGAGHPDMQRLEPGIHQSWVQPADVTGIHEDQVPA